MIISWNCVNRDLQGVLYKHPNQKPSVPAGVQTPHWGGHSEKELRPRATAGLGGYRIFQPKPEMLALRSDLLLCSWNYNQGHASAFSDFMFTCVWLGGSHTKEKMNDDYKIKFIKWMTIKQSDASHRFFIISTTIIITNWFPRSL